LSKIVGGFLVLLVALISGWLLLRTFYSEATCSFLYANEVASVRTSIKAIEDFRRKNGKLPPEPTTTVEVFSLGGYRALANGSYEVTYLGFDGPSITYHENGNRWQCGL
jgi:hypothetical protein